jgi:hypothetical protein
MRTRMLGKSILIVVFLFVSMNVSANIIFNFNEDLSDNEHSVEYIEDGYTLSVSAFKGMLASVANVNRFTNGLGVTNPPASGNIGAEEALSFSLDNLFTGTVNVYLNLFNMSDSALIAVDGAPDMTILNTNQSVWSFFLPSTSTFSITGLEVAGTNNDRFRIEKLEFVSAIPAPSTLIILSLGLIALSFGRFLKN